jgi:hypothetical protein
MGDKKKTSQDPRFDATLSRWSRLHLQSLAPTNPHWARVVGYGLFSITSNPPRLRTGAMLILKRLYTILYMHTYHPHFIPVGVEEASLIFLRDAHVLPKLFRCE